MGFSAASMCLALTLFQVGVALLSEDLKTVTVQSQWAIGVTGIGGRSLHSTAV